MPLGRGSTLKHPWAQIFTKLDKITIIIKEELTPNKMSRKCQLSRISVE